ncbi:MAG: ATP-binding protein [Bacteroidetes bacterium]|nr:ATP-binding protein [Bacteroidota bacterium]
MLHEEIIKRLNFYPVVGIIGSRQTGKTTLVKQLMSEIGKKTIYLDLESPGDLQKLESPELYFSQHTDKCVILDEIQNRPDLFPVLRSLIDKDRVPGRFIILGSASPALLRQSSESLAGRISYLQLHPLNFLELEGRLKMFDHWFRGGYPLSLLAAGDELSELWLDDFITSYVMRDLPALGLPTNPVLTRRLWTMLCHLNGQVLNYSEMARSLQISSPSVKTYLDFFENSFLIRRILPFFINTKKRIVKSPRLYLTDTGILHRLMNVSDMEDLQARPIIGSSWESYVINQVIPLLNPKMEVNFYRTRDANELDMVFTKGMNPIATAEIKYSSAPSLSKGNTIAINALGTRNNFIITPASDDFLLRINVRVCSLPVFLTKYLPEIQ